jgi:DNA-binding protein HU-beta
MKKLASNLRESARFNQQVSDSGIWFVGQFLYSCGRYYTIKTTMKEDSMNKGEMITLAAAKSGVSKKETKEVVDALVDLVGDVLKGGDTIQIAGFGTFKVSERAARQGRNPKTGETIQIAASRSPSFKAGKALKDKVNG